MLVLALTLVIIRPWPWPRVDRRYSVFHDKLIPHRVPLYQYKILYSNQKTDMRKRYQQRMKSNDGNADQLMLTRRKRKKKKEK